MINQNMGKIIDQIRAERQMSREDLCDDIMSVRNYQRFVSEEVNVSNDKLSKLVDKLNLDYFTVKTIYRHRGEDKYTKIHHVYTLMIANSDVQAYEELEKIDYDSIESEYMRIFYTYLKIDLERQLGKIPYEQAIDQLCELVDFPNLLEFEVLNFIELNVLVILNLYYSKKEDDLVAKFLYKFLLEEGIESRGLTTSFLPSLYSSTAQSLGTFKEYEKALEISDKGIAQCMKLQMFNALHNLYYFKALSHKQLGQEKEALHTLKRLYSLLHSLDNEDKSNEFIPILKKNFEKEIELIFDITENK